jgi:hypothetical protein
MKKSTLLLGFCYLIATSAFAQNQVSVKLTGNYGKFFFNVPKAIDPILSEKYKSVLMPSLFLNTQRRKGKWMLENELSISGLGTKETEFRASTRTYRGAFFQYNTSLGYYIHPRVSMCFGPFANIGKISNRTPRLVTFGALLNVSYYFKKYYFALGFQRGFHSNYKYTEVIITDMQQTKKVYRLQEQHISLGVGYIFQQKTNRTQVRATNI